MCKRYICGYSSQRGGSIPTNHMKKERWREYGYKENKSQIKNMTSENKGCKSTEFYECKTLKNEFDVKIK